MSQSTDYTTILETEDGIVIRLGCDYDQFGHDLDRDLGKYCSEDDAMKYDWHFKRSTGELFYYPQGEPVRIGEGRDVFVERHSYEYIADLEEGWSVNDNSRQAATQFARLRLKGEFKRFDIKPDSRVHAYGFWVCAYYMLQTAYRLEQFSDGRLWHNFYTLEALIDDEVIATADDCPTLDSDDNTDVIAEYFNVNELVKDARIARDAAAYKAIVNAGQFELSFDTEAVII